MTISSDFFEAVSRARDASREPLTIIWPAPGNPTAFLSFSDFAAWQAFVMDLSLRRAVPDIIATKFDRSQKLHLLAWIDYELVIAAELVAMTALELALRDRYLGSEKVRRQKLNNERAQEQKRTVTKKEQHWADNVSFADLLIHLVVQDGLTDEKIPLNQRCGGGKVVGFLIGEFKPSLAERRNGMAHGDPFGSSGAGSPCAGLLELIRDLIDYAYRDWNKLLIGMD